MNAYEWTLQLRDLFSPALLRAQAHYAQFGSGWERMTRRLPAGLNMARQSVDQLRARLDGLTRTRNITVDARGLRSLNQQIEQTERQLNRLQNVGRSSGGGGGSGGMLGRAKQLLPALGIAGLLAGAGGLAQSGMDREQTKVAFEQFVGKQGVTPLMKDLNRFADVTPYSNEDVYKSARTLLAAKVGPGELNSKMTNIGNMAAVSQKDFGEMSQSYAKIKQKGFVDSGELHMEFGGTAVMDQLKKNLGVNGEALFKMAEKRQIKFDDLDKAIADLSAKGGLYEGGLQKLADTAGGKLSTFMGTFGNKLTEWAATQNGRLAEIFDFGSAFLAKMGPIEEAAGKLFAAFDPLWATIRGLAVEFGLMGEQGSGVEGVVNAITKAINLLTVAVSVVASPFGQWILLLAGTLKTAMMLNAGLKLLSASGITTVGSALKALWGVMLANPVGLIIAGLVVVGTALKLAYDNVEWFRNGVDRAWGFLKNTFANMGVILRALFLPTPANLKAAFDVIGKAWNDAGNAVNTANEYKKREQAENERDDRGHVYAPKSPYGTEKPGGDGKGTTGKAAGLNGTVAGAKSTNITVNLQSLVQGLTINVKDMGDGLNTLEEKVQDALLRVLSSASALAN